MLQETKYEVRGDYGSGNARIKPRPIILYVYEKQPVVRKFDEQETIQSETKLIYKGRVKAPLKENKNSKVVSDYSLVKDLLGISRFQSSAHIHFYISRNDDKTSSSIGINNMEFEFIKRYTEELPIEEENLEEQVASI